jgi:integrase
MEHLWGPLLKKAGLPYRKPHTMRDTFITWAANGDEARGSAPVPLHVVAEWAGHASVQETEGYLHRQPGIYARGVHALDAYVTG